MGEAVATATGAVGQKKYKWREGAPYSDEAEAQAVGETMAAVEAANPGCDDLNAKFVEEAKDPASPLHKYAEWNDKTCGQKYREQQMAHLRRCVGVVIVDATQPTKEVIIPIFTSTTTYGEHSRGAYFPTDDGLKDPAQRAHIVQRALSEARAFMNKWQMLASVQPISGIIVAIKKALKHPSINKTAPKKAKKVKKKAITKVRAKKTLKRKVTKKKKR